MASLSDVLAQIRGRESGGNYLAQNSSSTASGGYQFVNGTWQYLTAQSGIGTQYSTAASAPSSVQDAVASYAVTHYDPNSTFLFAASAPAGGYSQVTDSSSPLSFNIVNPGDTTAASSGGGGLLGSWLFDSGGALGGLLGGGSSSTSTPGTTAQSDANSPIGGALGSALGLPSTATVNSWIFRVAIIVVGALLLLGAIYLLGQEHVGKFSRG